MPALVETELLSLGFKTSLLVMVALSSWTCGTHAHGLPSSYVAAVYEHRVALNPEPRVPLSRSAALHHLRQNLQVYSKQASRAALQGAKILVFPEDGLQGFNFTRSSIAAYLEVVPDPQQESWNPCEHPQRHPNTEGVRQFIFPTAWMNQLPLLDAIQFQRAFSLGANVTLLAANIRSDELIMTGSGIYSSSSAVYHHAQRGDPEEGRLVVAMLRPLEPLPDTLPVKLVPHKEKGYTEVRWCHSDGCKAPLSFTSSMMHDPFTFVLLSSPRGQLRVCDGSFCCWLQYQCMDTNFTEVYALGAFAGMHTVNGHYSLQVCALVKCAGADARSCGQEVIEAQTKMDFVLEGTFNTKHVYPSILSSHYTLEQPLLNTMAHGTVAMAHSHMRAGLITAALYGRTYHLDLH